MSGANRATACKPTGLTYDAIALYRASATSKGQGSAIAKTLGPRTLRALTDQFDRDEVGVETLGWTHGQWTPNRSGCDVQVNQRYRDSLVAVALVVVHEACHVAQQNDGLVYLEDELRCRQLELTFYRELRGGLTFCPPGENVPENVTVDDYFDLKEEDNWDRAGQLVDFTLSISDERNEHEYARGLTAEWIRRNQAAWGGLSNRWATTKGIYVKVLAADRLRNNGALIIEIMRTIQQATHWSEMMRHISKELRQVQQVVGSSLSPLAGGNVIRQQQVRALEQRWRVKLTT